MPVPSVRLAAAPLRRLRARQRRRTAVRERRAGTERSLRWHLLVLSFGALVPLFAGSAIAVWKAGAAYRNASSAHLQGTARSVALAVESRLNTATTTIDALEIAAPDADVRLASSVLHETLDIQVRPVSQWDKGMSPADSTELALTLQWAEAQQSPTVSNLLHLHGPAQSPGVLIVMPARAGHVPLALEMPMQGFASTLGAPRDVGTDTLIAVTDGYGRILARSREAPRFVGTLAPDWDRLQATGATRGQINAVAGDGTPIVLGFHRIAGTPGWVAVAGESERAYDARWQRPAVGLALATLLAVGLAGGLATWLARRILVPVRRLADESARIVSGEAERNRRLPVFRIAELEQLRHSFEASEDALRERLRSERAIAAQLAASERHYRRLAEAGTLVFWKRDATGTVTEGTGWTELTGQPLRQATGDGWISQVVDEDRALVVKAWFDAQDGGTSLDVEFRVKVRGGGTRWVRSRGVPIDAQAGSDGGWVGVIEDIEARRNAQSRVQHMAQHDALTGLGNRTLFRELIGAQLVRARHAHDGGSATTGAALPPDWAAAVLYVNVDRFKTFNDCYGLQFGDQILVRVAQMLCACAQVEDTVVRLGSDEFAVIQEALPQPAAASALADIIHATLAEGFTVNDEPVGVSVSIGIELLDARIDSADAAFEHAVLALDQARTDGGNRACFYDPSMNMQVQVRHQLERDLRTALDAGQFRVWFQPQLDLRTGRVTGAEALVRWQHPERGLVSPVEFIPVAERTGLIVPIGAWVLATACQVAAGWPDDMKLSVNVAPRQLAHPDLAGHVIAALNGSGLPGRRLDLEITENALMQDIQASTATLARLRTTGCGIVMDDFGTGQSSLGHLRAFPFSKVKIDRTFVNDIGERKEGMAVIAAVLGLCSSLGITSNAEGVETDRQAGYLRAQGCDEAQGFLYSRPVSGDELPATLARLRAQHRQTDDVT